MKSKVQRWKLMATFVVAFFLCSVVSAKTLVQEDFPEKSDTVSTALADHALSDSLSSYVESLIISRGFIHRLGIESHPSYVIPSHRFLKGVNPYRKLIRGGHSAHLKYSFQFQPNTTIDRIYGGAYQGIGVSFFSFGEKEYLGDPTVVYLFQGARMAKFSSRLSLNYEWNLGLSFGWKPFDFNYNNDNRVIGSRVNAYMDTDFYLNWIVSRNVDLNVGLTLSHFSNGNTKFPNAGLNTVGAKVGFVYNFNRRDDSFKPSLFQSVIPKFPRHISYDLVLFGSWRRKGVVYIDGSGSASPEAYTVLGFNFAPMYNVGYRFRTGVSLDGVYDGSANIYTSDYVSGTVPKFYTPSLDKQLALGLSGRIEYVMPYFTVGLGIGSNVLHAGGDLNGLYQILALKMEVTRNMFIHIGYNLQNFQDPNYLMLGLGYRFNNKYPHFRR